MHEEIYQFGQYASEEHICDIMMAGISYCDASYCIDRTSYPYEYYAIESVISGKGRLEIWGKNYSLAQNDTYFLYKGTKHRYFCDGDSWVKKWIVFDGRLVKSFLDTYLVSNPAVLHGFDSSSYLEEMLSLAKQKDLPYQTMTEEIFLIMHRMLIAAKNQNFEKDRIDSLSHQIKRYIDERIEYPLKLADLEQELHYSKNHLINVFKKEYHLSPYAYYTQKRIEVGKAYVINTKMSIKDIAARLQFESPQYFSKCFKKEYCLSPEQYRKQRIGD